MIKKHCRYYKAINNAVEKYFFKIMYDLVLLSKVLK